jgi:hypothetical protein
MNPFDSKIEHLVNASTGVIPGPDVATSITNALENGQQQAKEFMQQCLIDRKKSFYDPISKLKVPNFSATSEANKV